MTNTIVTAEIRTTRGETRSGKCCNFCIHMSTLEIHPSYPEGHARETGWNIVKRCPMIKGFVVGDIDRSIVSYDACTHFELTNDTEQLSKAITAISVGDKKMKVFP